MGHFPASNHTQAFSVDARNSVENDPLTKPWCHPALLVTGFCSLDPLLRGFPTFFFSSPLPYKQSTVPKLETVLHAVSDAPSFETGRADCRYDPAPPLTLLLR